MNWQDSSLANWIDSKVRDFDFKATCVILGHWSQHENNVKYLSDVGLSFYWFIRTTTVYSHDHQAIYFVAADNRSDGDKLIKIFSEHDNMSYARFYVGEKAINALSKGQA